MRKDNQESRDFSATAKALSSSDNSMDCLAAVMTTGLNDLKSLSLERRQYDRQFEDLCLWLLGYEYGYGWDTVLLLTN